jgi:hypothetical protein
MRMTKPAYNKPSMGNKPMTGGGFPLYQKPTMNGKPVTGGPTPKPDMKLMKMKSIQRRLTGE